MKTSLFYSFVIEQFVISQK